MNSFDINNNKIARQIEGSFWAKIITTNNEPEFVKFYDDGTMKIAFCNAKKLTENLFYEIKSMITDEIFDEIYGDVLLIVSGMGYDEFFDKYYNNIDPISRG